MKKRKNGFTLIEGLVALLVFTILVVTFYKIFTQTMTHMQDSKYRRGAVALANERMEHFRNLAYENIATKANAPVGDIEDDENVTVNGLTYRIISSVFFVDDPVDGVAPTDVRFEDYKRVSVTIVWGPATSSAVSKADAATGSQYSSKRIKIVSQFVPPGGLEAMPTGGILSVNVLNTGVEPVVPVAGATVLITDNECGTGAPHPECSSSILTGTTDASGNYMYIGAPICTGCYEISVTKSDYEARNTKDPFTGDDGDSDPYEEGEYEPIYAHQGVSAGDITSVLFNINDISQLNITSQDPFDEVIPSVQFDIYGGFILGTTVGGNISNVYDYSTTDQETDATNGDIDIYSAIDAANCECSPEPCDPDPCYASAGVYMIDFDLDDDDTDDSIPTGYTFWKMSPSDEINPHNVSVIADTDVEAKMIFLEDSYDGAWIRVVETINSESIPVIGATVQLESTTLDPVYDVTLTTDEFGYVYFPENTTDELVNEEVYDITVNADEYDEETDTITVDELTSKDITLTLST